MIKEKITSFRKSQHVQTLLFVSIYDLFQAPGMTRGYLRVLSSRLYINIIKDKVSTGEMAQKVKVLAE